MAVICREWDILQSENKLVSVLWWTNYVNEFLSCNFFLLISQNLIVLCYHVHQYLEQHTPPPTKGLCVVFCLNALLKLEETEVKSEAYQVVLQRIRPDVVLDHFSQLVSSCIGVIGKPGEEALWLLVLPFLPSFVWCLARTLRQVLREKNVPGEDCNIGKRIIRLDRLK